MKSRILTAVLLTLCLTASSQPYATRVLSPEIQTLLVRSGGESRPVLRLGGDEAVEISFDEMSHNIRYYSYTLRHCNADWTADDLFYAEYATGHPLNDITDYTTSLATTKLYTHYRFTLPNEDTHLRLSGNYVVSILEDEDTVATVCLCVVDERVEPVVTFRGNTDIEINRRYQQLDVELRTGGYSIRDPHTELTTIVQQNGRRDNQAVLTRPSMADVRTVRYQNNRDLIFEGGNEYRLFDIPSPYIIDTGVDRIDYNHWTGYNAFCTQQADRSAQSYSREPDADGRMVINAERTNDADTEADYMNVHLIMQQAEPWLNGRIYVGGDFNHNLMDEQSQMNYDFNLHAYTYSTLLKQGGYSYQLWFLPKGQTRATTLRTEGSHWQAENEYAVYVYHRPLGERYDHLVGYRTIKTVF